MTPPRLSAARRWPTLFYWASAGLFALPLGLLALTSLGDSPVVGFPLGRFTLRWYAAVLADDAARDAFALSLGLAAGTALLATLAGTWIALAAALLRPPMRRLLLAATLLPLVTPGIVHAIALRIAISRIGLDPGPLAILAGHVVHATPLAAVMVGARLATVKRDLMDAARDLGAGPVRAFLGVQLPWLAPALTGAALLAGLSSFDDFLRSYFLGGYTPTLPVLIFARLRDGLTPEIDALATLTLLAGAALAAIPAGFSDRTGRTPPR